MYKDDEYKIRKDPAYLREDSDLMKRAAKRKDEYELEKKESSKDRIVRQAMPRMEDTKLKVLKLKGSKVIGSIFDRVQFLEARISEIDESLSMRKRLNEDMIKNIENDIKDKENMVLLIADSNERRNIKMDISILRKEKRNEQLQFWKDTTELMTELRDISEQYQTEKKIVAIFQGDTNDE